MKCFVTIFLTLLMMIFTVSAFAQKDSLIMNTSEILVGEIKSFDKGVVIIETDYSDSDFKVEWNRVVSINTEQKIIVISDEGDRYFGRPISESDDLSYVMIDNTEAGQPVLNIMDIVFFKEVDDTFWSRVELKLSAGYTLTKANNSHQLIK